MVTHTRLVNLLFAGLFVGSAAAVRDVSAAAYAGGANQMSLYSPRVGVHQHDPAPLAGSAADKAATARKDWRGLEIALPAERLLGQLRADPAVYR